MIIFVQRIRDLLIPKLRSQFAEFLYDCYLRAFVFSTCLLDLEFRYGIYIFLLIFQYIFVKKSLSKSLPIAPNFRLVAQGPYLLSINFRRVLFLFRYSCHHYLLRSFIFIKKKYLFFLNVLLPSLYNNIYYIQTRFRYIIQIR